MSEVEHLYIVGAGFSSYAGLPLTSNLTKALLDTSGHRLYGPNGPLVALLKQFVDDAFDHDRKSVANFWPHLEDIFTCIDLSANSGHHLGVKYTPSALRTVRRGLIVRIMRMLRRNYAKGKQIGGSDWKRLEDFFESLPSQRCAFLSMNWDTVIEEGLGRTQKIFSFDYGCDAQFAQFNGTNIELANPPKTLRVQLLKPHGSINWMYCDNCRQLFWFPARMSHHIDALLFKESDWKSVQELTGESYKKPSPPGECPKCKTGSLGTRLATFSYRKALDFPMHQKSWYTAERLLRMAKTWIFAGYSLPAADYEFKYLLKWVQLSMQTPPALVLITGGEPSAADLTRESYQKFFGPRMGRSSPTVFTDGLDRKAMNYLKTLGALNK